MATTTPCALPYTSPCGCWRLRRTVRGTPLVADAGDADEQSVRFVDLHSLRMLAMAKDEQPVRLPNTNPCGCWRWRGTVCLKLHSLRMLEMATNSPCALPNSNPCGCWRWRRADRVPPVLADAGDADQQPMRFGELQSLRMLEIAKDSPLERNSTACGCSRWRRTIRALCRTPILADVGDGEGQSVKLQSLRMLEMATKSPFALSNSNPCGCWKRRRTVRVTPVLVDAGDGGGQFIRPAELHSLRLWR